MRPRLAAALACFVLLAGCASAPFPFESAPVPTAEAPAYAVGDRWVYRIHSNFRNVADVEETHTIASLGADGIGVQVTVKGAQIDLARSERWVAPGQVAQGAMMDVETRRFAQPLERFRYPMGPGVAWNQWVQQTNETQRTSGVVNYYARVQGTARITTPAGTFDTLRLSVIMQLDDETPFRWPTECSYLVWYAPAVKAVVREERRATWREKTSSLDAMTVTAQSEVVELVAHVPAR
jgi:hypothetical protein